MIKHLRLASDLHLDFDANTWENLPNYHPARIKREPEIDHLWYPRPHDDDHETILLLPGDLWHTDEPYRRRFGGNESWIERVAKRFHSIVIVLGNHDYWDTSLERGPEKAREALASFNVQNVHVLQNSSIIIENVKLLGGTLWTDYNKNNPLIEMNAPNFMKPDFKYIRRGRTNIDRRGIWPRDLCTDHVVTREYIKTHAVRDNPEQAVVVLTHHAPSFESVDDKYRNSYDWDSNFYYFSDLDGIMHEPDVNIDLWVHGHMHTAKDYVIDRTRVICNPRGYQPSESVATTGFDENLKLTVAELRSCVSLGKEDDGQEATKDESGTDHMV